MKLFKRIVPQPTKFEEPVVWTRENIERVVNAVSWDADDTVLKALAHGLLVALRENRNLREEVEVLRKGIDPFGFSRMWRRG
jgi:hypothetical protein